MGSSLVTCLRPCVPCQVEDRRCGVATASEGQAVRLRVASCDDPGREKPGSSGRRPVGSNTEGRCLKFVVVDTLGPPFRKPSDNVRDQMRRLWRETFAGGNLNLPDRKSMRLRSGGLPTGIIWKR